MSSQLLNESCSPEVVSHVLNIDKVRLALYDQPGVDPAYSVLPDLRAYGVLMESDYELILHETTRKRQVLKLIETLKTKDHPYLLAIFIISLFRNRYAHIAKIVHDHWHKDESEAKCFPDKFCAPELKFAKPKISIGAGFFALNREGAVKIKNKVRDAYNHNGAAMKLMIDEILTGAETDCPSYYCVLVQINHENTLPENAIIRNYEEAIKSRLLIIHIKAKRIKYEVAQGNDADYP